jgi:glycosyltransferase involved in cell wall biosynthesis
VLDFGGVESRIVLQSAMIDRNTFDFRVCTFWKAGAAADKIQASGIPVDVLNIDPSVRNPLATYRLVKYLRQLQPHILHASISEGIFHGALAGELANIPIKIVEEVGIPNRGRVGRAVYSELYPIVDRVVGVSKATCDILRSEGCPEDRLVLIYNCANPVYFQGPPPQRTIAKERTEFIAVGRLVEVKNHLNLIRAFAETVKQNPNVRLRIVGDGPLEHDYRRLIEELGMEKHIELLGFRDDIKALLEASDCFLLPSWTEGCSISLVEAMSTGIVPLGSTADGIGEVMGALGARHQIPPDDVSGWTSALLWVASLKASERAIIGATARDIAFQRFSPEVNNRNVTGMYLELMESKL